MQALSAAFVALLISQITIAYAQSIPPEIESSVRKNKADCPGKSAKILKGFISLRDVNGDGNPDILLDYDWFECARDGTQLNCGSGGCLREVYVYTNKGYKNVHSGQSNKMTFKKLNNVPVMTLELHGSYCNKVGVEECIKNFYWDGSTFSSKSPKEMVRTTTQPPQKPRSHSNEPMSWGVSIDAVEQEASLTYGEPSTDNSLLSISCNLRTKTADLTVFLAPSGVKDKSKSFIALESSNISVKLPAIGEYSHMHKAVYLRARMKNIQDFVSVVSGKSSFNAGVSGSSVDIPFGKPGEKALYLFQSRCQS